MFIIGDWTPLKTQEDIENLVTEFVGFSDAVLSDLKFFSANQTDFPQDRDASDESHVYVKFTSYNPEIADNKDKNEVVIKFTGVKDIKISSGKFNLGTVHGLTFDVSSPDEITLEIDNTGESGPTVIHAESAGWSYDYGDDMK